MGTIDDHEIYYNKTGLLVEELNNKNYDCTITTRPVNANGDCFWIQGSDIVILECKISIHSYNLNIEHTYILRELPSHYSCNEHFIFSRIEGLYNLIIH